MPLCFLAPHHVLLGGGTGGASLDPCGPASSQDRPMDTLPTESGGIWRSLRGSVQAGRLYRGPPGPGCALTPPAYLHCLPSRQPGLWATGSATQSAQGDHRHPAGPGLWPQPVTLLPSEPPPQTSRTPRTAFPWLPGSAWEQGEARLGWIASRHPHRGCCCSLLPGTLVTSCPHTDNAGGGGAVPGVGVAIWWSTDGGPPCPGEGVEQGPGNSAPPSPAWLHPPTSPKSISMPKDVSLTHTCELSWCLSLSKVQKGPQMDKPQPERSQAGGYRTSCDSARTGHTPTWPWPCPLFTVSGRAQAPPLAA